jgi:2-polyprenyl-3-methyl-5-hydroxy-6-metoxy-1,4-benzoquinol methylase
LNNPPSVNINCPICLSEEIRELFTLFDDRYGYQGKYPLFKCKKCKHIFLNVNFTKESLESLYTKYYPRSELILGNYRAKKKIKWFKCWLDGAKGAAFRWVPEKIRILDIGCGFCETLGYHKDRGCDVYGVEADENVRRVAEKYGYNIHIGIFDPNRYEQDYFDYVTMDQVMEHIADPVETMRGISGILKKGGRLIVSTPNAGGWGAKIFRRRWINWHAPYHLHHFSVISMEIAAEKAGLIVEKVSTITSSEWLHYQWSHLCTFPVIGVPSAFWSPKGTLNLFQKSTLFLLNILHKSKINHLITRFFDSINFGDNFLFVLRKP